MQSTGAILSARIHTDDDIAMILALTVTTRAAPSGCLNVLKRLTAARAAVTVPLSIVTMIKRNTVLGIGLAVVDRRLNDEG